MLGVERSTVIDGVEFDGEAEIAVIMVRPRARARRDGADCASGAARHMTRARDEGAGGLRT